MEAALSFDASSVQPFLSAPDLPRTARHRSSASPAAIPCLPSPPPGDATRRSALRDAPHLDISPIPSLPCLSFSLRTVDSAVSTLHTVEVGHGRVLGGFHIPTYPTAAGLLTARAIQIALLCAHLRAGAGADSSNNVARGMHCEGKKGRPDGMKGGRSTKQERKCTGMVPYPRTPIRGSRRERCSASACRVRGAVSDCSTSAALRRLLLLRRSPFPLFLITTYERQGECRLRLLRFCELHLRPRPRLR
ncbi:hypothetical protein C8R45DRAFT_987528 [Mycena sanguinolenta]|nr:hypothetical protein C8R45DRAFT_987528 [Mycena sanguinolenta]